MVSDSWLESAETGSGAAVIRSHLNRLPDSPGVYRMLDADGRVLYVGKAKSLRKRVAAYTRATGHGPRIRRMIARTRDMEFVLTGSEAEALLTEADLIKSLKPLYNILLRDDKSYPSVLVRADHDFPTISVHRGARKTAGDYVGPFASSAAAHESAQALQRAFQLRTCSDSVFAHRSRPCLMFQIKRCTAPCTGEITREAYAERVAAAAACLHGKGRGVYAQMQADMRAAAAVRNFEAAADMRDRMKALDALNTDSAGVDLGDADVFALARSAAGCAVRVFVYRGGGSRGDTTYFPTADPEETDTSVLSAVLGQFYQTRSVPQTILVSHVPDDHALLARALSQKADARVRIKLPRGGPERAALQRALRNASEALERKGSERGTLHTLRTGLADLLGLDAPPERIEVYDNSHISGTHAVGAMIVAGPEGFLKNQYRLYKHALSDLTPGDDYAMMRRMLERRLRGFLGDAESGSPRQRPDLLIIDGGAGQLSVVREVLIEYGCDDMPLLAVAKGADRNAGNERFFLPDREPFTLPHRDPLLHYVQRLRDEAHRFAIGAHRAARSRRLR